MHCYNVIILMSFSWWMVLDVEKQMPDKISNNNKVLAYIQLLHFYIVSVLLHCINAMWGIHDVQK